MTELQAAIWRLTIDLENELGYGVVLVSTDDLKLVLNALKSNDSLSDARKR